MSQIEDSVPSSPAEPPKPQKRRHIWPRVLLLASSYFLVEVFATALLQPESLLNLGFGFLWAWLLTAVTLALPPLWGRIFYGVTYYAITAWTLAQTGYYQLFRKLMWVSDIFYAQEGSDYFGDVLKAFPALWWFGGLFLLMLGALCIVKLPRWKKNFQTYLAVGLTAGLTLAGIFLLPQVVFLQDLGVWGTQSDYMQSTSYRATYNTLYDARRVYNICGIYQLTARDIWKHEIYPLTPAYYQSKQNEIKEVHNYFDSRKSTRRNTMTGAFAGKNVIFVLMESMDDWVITPEDTPTLYRLMNEGIQFTDFYTPGFGSVRTFNTEFCANTGVFLSTTGGYAFDYVTNHFNESLANRLKEAGYSAETFHYNTPDFYSRGVFEPAMGYSAYNSYEDYTDSEDDLFNDCYLFDNQDLSNLFFRDGPTLNFVITRSAHLSYVYNEVLSAYALRQYPEYRGKYGHEEVDCIRVKARLVDDFFTRLLSELEARGQLKDTVIVAYTDHYAYGFKDVDTMLALSGVEDTLLLEKTPCFIWSQNGPELEVDKTLNTSDLLPTLLNLLGIKSSYAYLGQDAFDNNYPGYAIFPDGSWISQGIACSPGPDGILEILRNDTGAAPSQDFLDEMSAAALEFIRINNLLLSTDYYKTQR